MRLSRAKYLLLFSSTAWFSAPTWWAGDGSRPQAIVDVNRDRSAIPRLGPNLIVDASWSMGVNGGTSTATNSPAGQLNLFSDGTNATRGDQSFATVIGRCYLVRSTIAGVACGTYVGTTQGAIDNYNNLIGNTGTMGHIFTASATTTWIRFRHNLSGLSTVTNISVREVSDELAPATFGECLTVSATRSATASTYVDSDGLMKSLATSDVPRFTWLGGRRRLLVEPAATNLALQSETRSITWSSPGATIVSDASPSPTGAVTADKLVEDTSSGFHANQQSYAGFTSGISYTYTEMVAPQERGWCWLFLPAAPFGGIFSGAYFNLLTGAVGTIFGSVLATAGIRLANGFWVFSITKAATATTTGFYGIGISPSDYGGNYTGDGTSGILLGGGQLEATAYPTSYIPTVGSTVTRAAEVVTGSALLTAMMRRAAGTLVMRYVQQDDPINAPAIQTAWAMGIDAGNSRLSMRKAAGSATESPQFVCGNGSAVTTFVPAASGGADAGESVGAVIAWNASNSRAASKGALLGGADGVAWDAAGNATSVLYLGRNSDGSTPSAMLIDQIVLYAARVSNNALPGLAVAS